MTLHVLLSTALAIMMFAMGLGLRVEDFRRLLYEPKLTLVCLFAQMVLLPLLALVLATGLGLGAAAATGLLLVALCPSGTTSNFFTRLGGGNLALSVSLTAFSSLITVVTLPMILLFVAPMLGYHGTGVQLSFLNAVENISLHTLLPVVLGMSLRAFLPDFGRRIEPAAVVLSSLLFFIVVFVMWYQSWDRIVSSFLSTGLATIGLLIGAMTLGWWCGHAIKAKRADKFTMMIEVGVQNGALAIFIAVNLMKDTALAGPPTVYTVAMVVGAVAGIVWHRAGKNAKLSAAQI